MIVKKFRCPNCYTLLQTSLRRLAVVCPVCAAEFRPVSYRLAVKKAAAVGRIEQAMHRSGN